MWVKHEFVKKNQAIELASKPSKLIILLFATLTHREGDAMDCDPQEKARKLKESILIIYVKPKLC